MADLNFKQFGDVRIRIFINFIISKYFIYFSMYIPVLTLNRFATEYLLVFLHGLSGCSETYYNIFKESSKSFPNVKMIFPSSPIQDIELAENLKMSGWFTFRKKNFLFLDEPESLKHSAEKILHLIEKQGFKFERVILCGFSQGGALALYLAMTARKRFLGIVCASGFLPFTALVRPEVKQDILMIHGKNDEYLKIKYIWLMGKGISFFHPNTIFLKHDGSHKMPSYMTYVILSTFLPQN